MAASPAKVLLCSGDCEAADIRQGLSRAGYAVQVRTLDGAMSEMPAAQLAVLDAGTDPAAALRLCRLLRAQHPGAALPILLVTHDHAPAARLPMLQAGATAYLLRPFDPDELLAQTHALLRVKEDHDRLGEKAAEVQRLNRRLQQAYHQVDLDLELAGRVQRSLLPQSLPVVAGARLAVHHQPRGAAGGDFYDVFRLDERHLGLYVADAAGCGVKGALLAAFVQRGVRPTDLTGTAVPAVQPEEVLRRLNADLIALALSEVPFLTMVYVLCDLATGSLSFARSGHPHPLYLPLAGEPEFWQAEGSLLGVFETHFIPQSRQLQVGDKVLLYTDGIEGGGFEGHPHGAASLLACAARHRQLPIEELVPRLARELFAGHPQGDDLTLLGLEATGPASWDSGSPFGERGASAP